MLEILQSLPCQVILSGYASALYDEMLDKWCRLGPQVMHQAGVVTEVIRYNFEIDRLHWSRHAGNNPNHRRM